MGNLESHEEKCMGPSTRCAAAGMDLDIRKKTEGFFKAASIIPSTFFVRKDLLQTRGGRWAYMMIWQLIEQLLQSGTPRVPRVIATRVKSCIS
jgi:hypothetical protein